MQRPLEYFDLNSIFPGIKSEYNLRADDVIRPPGKSVSSFTTKQLLIQSYAPRIAVMSSKGADDICRSITRSSEGKESVNNVLDLLNYFEQTFSSLDQGKVSLSGPPSRLHIKFTRPIHEQLTLQSETGTFEMYNSKNFENVFNEYIKQVDSRLRGLLDGKSHESMEEEDSRLLNNSIYSKLLLLSLNSNSLSPFEFYNHPIIQLFVISASDEFEEIKSSVLDYQDKDKYPNWIDIDQTMPLFLIFVNSDNEDELQKGLKLQEDIKIKLGIKGIITSFKVQNHSENIQMKELHFSNFLSADNLILNDLGTINVPNKVYEALMNTLNDLIYKNMVPFMERKMKVWAEEIVAPRKSFTGRLFNRKWGSSSSSSLPLGGSKTKAPSSFFSFGGSSSADLQDEKTPSSEPATPPHSRPIGSSIGSGTYFDADSPEMLIRRKADWSFILRDYKSSYTTYELIKKDFINAKAYIYLASLQEFMVVSLLIGSSNKLNPMNMDAVRSGVNLGGITMKIITDVINPFVDGSYYTYVSRYSLKTHAIRLLITIAELYVCLGQSSSALSHQNVMTSTNSVSSEVYFIEALKLIKKLLSSRLLDSNGNGKLMERISYIYDNFGTRIPEDKTYSSPQDISEDELNLKKLEHPELDIIGMKRSRQSLLWLLLASKELDPVSKPVQVQFLLQKIEKDLNSCPNYASDNDFQWLLREQGLVERLKETLSNSL